MFPSTKIKNLSFKKRVLLIAIVITSLLLLFVNIKENIRHHQLASSMDALHTELKAADLPAEKTSGCGSGQGVYGPTGRSCSISLVIMQDRVESLGQANLSLKRFKDTIESTDRYYPENALPVTVTNSENPMTHGGGYYYERKTGTGCGASFDYKSEELSMRLRFTCDDSSWFTRTFQFN